MKKILLIFIALACSMLILACSGNGGGGEQAHVHTPGDPATCLEPQICLDCQGVLEEAKGHSYDGWTTDDYKHWKECVNCRSVTSSASHALTTRSNAENHWKECVCGIKLQNQKHVYANYMFDDQNHWQKCSCGVKSAETTHSFGAWHETDDVTLEKRECDCGHFEMRPAKTVVAGKVSGLPETMTYLSEINLSDISYTVEFSDSTEKVFTGRELTVDYGNFSTAKLGKQSLTVGVKAFNSYETVEIEILPITELKVLMIGNSFSDDASQWVNEICKDLGIKITIGNMFIGGCTLDTHYANLIGNKNAYEFRTYSSNTLNWTTRTGTSISYALNYDDWDFVTLQQASGNSGESSTYALVSSIISEILTLKSDVRFVWHMTWAYHQTSTHKDFYKYDNDQMTMYEAITSAVQSQIVNNRKFLTVIPSGTAIQNARTSYLGDSFTRDGYHLTYDLGRYIAGVTLVHAMTGVDVSELEYMPSGVNEYGRAIAIESATNAVNSPFKVTASKYVNEPSFDLTGLKEIDCEVVGCAYYVSTDANTFDKIVTTAGNSINFATTKRFTKAELPVGSVIEIKNGFQYRPEAWLGESVMTTRPNNVTTRFFRVTEDWWGAYKYRAFNISTTTGASVLEAGIETVRDAFSIYVPESVADLDTNPYDENDAQKFTANGLDIDDYTLVLPSLCSGFYDSSNWTTPTIITDHKTLSYKFLCTNSFTKQTLPVGSVLIVDSGYQYRPDAWTGNVKNPARPANVTTTFVKVDDAWWGNYVVRTFNVSKTSTPVINTEYHDVAKHFRIYIPN